MLDVSVLRAKPEIQRQERETETLVLRDMPQLVTPHRGRRLHAGDDHVSERDGTEPALGQNEVREAATADVKEATIPTARKSEREQPQDMADRVGVVRNEYPTQLQGIAATTSSTAARTRARVVTDESKYSVMSRSLRSTATDATP